MLEKLRAIASHKHQVTLIDNEVIQELSIRVSKAGAIVVVFNHYKGFKQYIQIAGIESVNIDHIEYRLGAMKLNDVYHATITLKK